MNKNTIITNIRNGIIKYPELRTGECFSSSKIYLYVLNIDRKNMNLSRLCDSLEEGIEYFSKTLPSGTYFITCKEQKKIEIQRWELQLDI